MLTEFHAAKAQNEAMPASAPSTSALWGEKGELWSASSRLPDFSRAGYRSGAAPIPRVAVAANVRDFGAKGDGQTDDAPAFNRAIAATTRGAILIPAGRYVLRGVVRIEKSDLVLRGEGAGQTVLLAPASLSELDPRPSRDGGKAHYSFTGGFLTVAGKTNGATLADVAEPAPRGARKLVLSQPVDLARGALVRLQMSDANHTLGRHLHGDEEDAGQDTYARLEGRPWVSWTARVVAVNGRELTLDRPLRLDVRPEWKPQLLAYEPTVVDVGIENLSFEFPGRAKMPHLKEEGFNAIHFSGVSDCWVRGVTITDADNGIIVSGSRFCTVEDTHFRHDKRRGLTGHHALWATGSQECLFQKFRFDTTYEHDITVEGRATGNVFRDGSGVALNFDHHRNAPYENLFTNIDVGDARRVYASSGRGDRGPHSGARTTFWGLRAQRGEFPPAPRWPRINVIGMGRAAPSLTAEREWIEPLGGRVQPPDLYEAQRGRLGR